MPLLRHQTTRPICPRTRPVRLRPPRPHTLVQSAAALVATTRPNPAGTRSLALASRPSCEVHSSNASQQ